MMRYEALPYIPGGAAWELKRGPWVLRMISGQSRNSSLMPLRSSKEHELGRDVPLIGLVAAQDLCEVPKQARNSRLCPSTSSRGTPVIYHHTAFRNASAISAER